MTLPKEKWQKGGITIAPCYPLDLEDTSPAYRELKSAKRKEVVELLQPVKGRVVLEAATGKGTFGIDLAMNGAHVIAVDISGEMLRKAGENARLANVEDKIVFILGDTEALPFKDSSFDAVICIAALYHFPNPKQAVAEWSRVLKNEGRLIVDFVPFNPVPVHAFLDISLHNPTLKGRLRKFMVTILMDFLSLAFGFAWGRTRATHYLYYKFFNVPVRHYTKRQVLRLLQQYSIYPVSIKRRGHRLWPFEFRICGERRDS